MLWISYIRSYKSARNILSKKNFLSLIWLCIRKKKNTATFSAIIKFEIINKIIIVQPNIFVSVRVLLLSISGADLPVHIRLISTLNSTMVIVWSLVCKVVSLKPYYTVDEFSIKKTFFITLYSYQLRSFSEVTLSRWSLD